MQELGPRIEIVGNKRIVVDGCDGIIDYDDEKVSIKLGKMKVDISGKSLKLKVLTVNTAVITGYVRNIEYIY